MLIVRTGAGQRSSRWSGTLLIAPAVAVGMYEKPPPRSLQAPVSSGSEATVAYAAGAPAWRWAPTPSRSSAGRVVANSRPTRAIVSASTPHSRRALLDGGAAELVEQLVVAVGVRAAPVLVVEAGVDDRAHHPDGERGVGARQRAQMLVGEPRRAAAEGIDDHEPRALPARVEQLAPEVRRGRQRVPAPDEQVARVRPLLRVDLRRHAVRLQRAGDPGGRADRSLECRGPERVHHARRHGVALDQALRAHVAVGQDRLAAELVARAGARLGHAVERLVPGGAPEAAVLAHQRVEDALARSRRGRGSSRPSRTGSRR